jgi:Uma2 family endonuclease
MGMAAPVYYTAEMVRALPDDSNRYETVHGELLVTPAPRTWHQVVLARLFRALDLYLQRTPAGHVLWSPADISWSPDTLVQPDLFVVPTDELRALDWAHIKHLLLVVEVLSPTTARGDRFTKRRLYQEMRVPTYWIVDAEQRLVEVWAPEAALPAVEHERVEWHPAGAAEPLVLSVSELFRPL